MATDNPDDKTPTETKSIKDVATSAFTAVKTPVFWLAIGFFACKFMDRKLKR